MFGWIQYDLVLLLVIQLVQISSVEKLGPINTSDRKHTHTPIRTGCPAPKQLSSCMHTMARSGTPGPHTWWPVLILRNRDEDKAIRLRIAWVNLIMLFTTEIVCGQNAIAIRCDIRMWWAEGIEVGEGMGPAKHTYRSCWWWRWLGDVLIIFAVVDWWLLVAPHCVITIYVYKLFGAKGLEMALAMGWLFVCTAIWDLFCILS